MYCSFNMIYLVVKVGDVFQKYFQTIDLVGEVGDVFREHYSMMICLVEMIGEVIWDRCRIEMSFRSPTTGKISSS